MAEAKNCNNLNEAVCIQTDKIYDSCREGECSLYKIDRNPYKIRVLKSEIYRFNSICKSNSSVLKVLSL